MNNEPARRSNIDAKVEKQTLGSNQAPTGPEAANPTVHLQVGLVALASHDPYRRSENESTQPQRPMEAFPETPGGRGLK